MNDLQKQINQLQKEYDILDGIIDLKDAVIAELKEENERIIKENAMLLGQLVINDGEDVTVQISKSQFDEYNKYRATLQEIKKILSQAMDVKSNAYNHFSKVEQAISLITKAEEE